MSEIFVRRRLISLVTTAVLAAAVGLRAQSNGAPNATNGTPHGRKSLKAQRTETALVIDGALNDAAWEEVSAADSLTQKEPREGEPSTERTDIRVLYTATTLYVAVFCGDSDPAGIIANERRRDADLGGDDSVAIVLDTFHDHRNAFLFRTNPLGTQYDALLTDEGRASNISWDERWEVATQRTEDGWTAEFAIPFKSLRVPETADGMTWGIDVERVIRRKNEAAYWNDYRRAFRFEEVSHAGHLDGISQIETGLRLRVKPYVSAGFSHTSDRAGGNLCQSTDPLKKTGSAYCNASDVGLEVVKYRITPSLTADLTWNTDFAQADVDDLQVNFERFPRLFPEKREFFQEGVGTFDFGVGGGGTTSMRLFHSRQIGFSPRRRPVPIQGGGRLTGKFAGLTVGLLNVQTESLPIENVPASNYSVARVKRDVFERSTVGAFYLNRELAGSSDFNRLYGMDAGFSLHRYLKTDGFFARSEDSGADSNWVVNANATFDNDFFMLGFDFLSIDPGFRDDLGFISRSDVHRLFPQIAIRPRPNIPYVRRLEFAGSWDYTMTASNDVLRRTDKYIFQMVFQDGGVFRMIPYDYELDVVSQPFRVNDVLIPAGRHQWRVMVLRYNFSPKRLLSGALDYSHRAGYYGGNMHKFQITPTVKLNEHFSVENNYEVGFATLPNGEFAQHVANVGINYSLNNQWLTSTTLQWDNIESFFGMHFRLNYIFRPGDDFFLIYNDGRLVDGPNEGQRDRSLKAKVTYSFDF
jgi:hypothetical protein